MLWYIIGFILGILFLTECKEEWGYNRKWMSISFATVGLLMLARSAYKLSHMFS